MPSLFDIAREDRRQAIANDTKFWKNFVYFFELQAPKAGIGARTSSETGSSLFPLVLNPQTITMSDPFTVSATPTLDGGLFVEENGIISRQLTITGQTGFAPRKGPKGADYDQNTKFEDAKGRSSFRYRGKTGPQKLSGQRHFHFIQDRVFRTYGDLKRNPNLAKDTRLFFHNPKDDEHWEVIPQSFTMDRDARRPFTYQYTIVLLVVGTADIEPAQESEDTSMLAAIKNIIRGARGFTDNLNATIRDLPSEILMELNEAVPGLSGAVDVVGLVTSAVPAFINATSAFVDGTTSLITTPINSVTRLTRQVEAALTNLVSSPFRARDSILQSFRQLEDAFDGFKVHPQTFATNVQQQLSSERRRQELTTSVSQDSLLVAEESPSTSLRQVDDLGTGLLAGDRERARAETGVARNEPATKSGKVYVVQQGDTLPRLAARYLDDKTRWRQIAVLNGLRSPYISEQRLPATRRIGDQILIPSPEEPPTDLPTLGIFGVSLDAPESEKLLGSDLRLTDAGDDARGFFDMEVDDEGGSIDFKLSRGIPNLIQAVRTRLTTEQGTDVLYRQLGYKRIIGLGIREVDQEMTEFRLTEAVEADPRIVGIRAVEFSTSQPDVVDVEMDAEVRGFNDQVPVKASLT